MDGKRLNDPANLGKGWIGFDLDKAFGVYLKRLYYDTVSTFQGCNTRSVLDAAACAASCPENIPSPVTFCPLASLGE